MGFRGGIGPGSGVGPSTTGGGGGTTRTTVTSTFVPGGSDPKTKGSSTTVTVTVVVPASAGIFAGTSTETAVGGEARERQESVARLAELLQAPERVRGPIIAPQFELGRALPMGNMPRQAADHFLAMAARGKV